MKFAKNLVRTITFMCLIFAFLLWSMIIYSNSRLAENYYVAEGKSLSISPIIEVIKTDEQLAQASTASKIDKTALNEIKLFGIFPIKTVTVTNVPKTRVVPGGIPFGIKIISDGVMVTAISGVNNNGNIVSPAKQAGIKAADVIVGINGKNVNDNDDVVNAVKKSGGKSLNIKVKNENGEVNEVAVTPVLDTNSGDYRIGIMVRDSSAGIGTISFYDAQSGIFAGLGHAVCDVDTGACLSLANGQVVRATIDSITPGKNGTPGQLNGHFASVLPSGMILKNDKTGVFGTLKSVDVENGSVEVALKQQIKTGKATMLTTVSGDKSEEFEIEIEKIAYGNSRSTKNMIVHVTDKRLLAISGGIVQGMSGSPILQDGRLVGAVTHVFVNDSTRGYAIFAENMLDTAQGVANENKLKEAS